MTEVPSVIAFGALAPWPSQDQLQHLREKLHHDSSFHPIITAIRDTASLWKTLVDEDPALSAVPGQDAVCQLEDLLTGTAELQIPEEKRNLLIMPITVITQIVQYLSYLEYSDIEQRAILDKVAAGGGIQGFCVGLLSALAVAGGTTKQEVIVLATTAIKLAFCVGAYVDLDQARNTRASNIAVRWRAPTRLEDIEKLLNSETYVSVIRDVRDITITTPTLAVPTLQQDLSDHGVSFLDTGLSGRYHTDLHGDIPAKIMKASHEYLSPRFGDQELVWSNTDAKPLPRDNAIHTALQSILIDQANWHLTISRAASMLTKISGNPSILAVGVDAIPQSIGKSFPVIKVKSIMLKTEDISRRPNPLPGSTPEEPANDPYPEDAIAVIGMSCKFPGADSIDEFWGLLTEGKSMLNTVPKERFDKEGLTRSRGLKFFGNFIRDIESFDHKFFKKTSRESMAMDPQQRLLLQVAYQALESSGYFSDPAKPRDIGCYIGLCATDYDSNVASHPASAYSTIGTLRAFLSGKISHHFGFSGPSLTFDTACSSSAVAIHTACTALRMNECSQAVAGGVTLVTSPYLYENLAAAHFLSPTGATKPFDASADGYCRGEGLGLVVLKKLSNAIADNDNILGVIGGSAINQNDNCVSITVPHALSQGNLYRRVAKQAGIEPQKVDFVEAHGTGTPVGDPIEMESIRRVFGGPSRDTPLYVSSVKGNIGHLEGASGVAALIKALLQMEFRTACIQASFKTLNPKIHSLESDKICIPTSNLKLPQRLLTALVNNYGAAGSNASIMLLEGPRKQTKLGPIVEQDLSEQPSRLPIQIAAASVSSLVNYCQLLEDYCRKQDSSLNDAQRVKLLPHVAFSLARQNNQGLAHMLSFSATTMSEFRSELRDQMKANHAIKTRPKEPPLILCFGGQVGEYVALSKHLRQHSSLFRFHLDLCNETLLSMGYPGLYPTIFQTDPVKNIVALQSAIFSVQYACAHAWLDSGLHVDGVIGHSLGQFAALCVSGVLSLRDGLNLVAGRASLMQKYWGSESGTMIAIEADLETIKELTSCLTAAEASHTYEIACYNGPSSHVLVSDKASADELQAELLKRSIRHKRLNVTHGFHSQFTEPLIPQLEALASSLILRKAKIPIETCTEGTSWAEPTAQLIASHTRDPVFFGQAVQRIQARVGSCTFLEAGSDSSIISMVRRALDNSKSTSNNFMPTALNKAGSLDGLVDTTINLWDHGHAVQFWNFHRLQTAEYDILRLPPYQFDKHKHWMELDISAPKESHASRIDTASLSPPPPPVLIRPKDKDSQGHNFEVDSRSAEYQTLVEGHMVLGKVECPVSFYVELISRAINVAEANKPDSLISFQYLQIQYPLGLATDREINVRLQRLGNAWTFSVTSRLRSASDPKHTAVVCHATGEVSLQASGRALADDFARVERLTSHGKRAAANDANEADATSVEGHVIYKLYSQTEKYADFYRNVKRITSSGSQVFGKVLPPKHIPGSVENSAIQPHVIESFIQVAGLHANCIHESPDDEVLRLSGIDRIQFGPEYQAECSKNLTHNAWDVLGFVSANNGELAYDIFVYNAITGRLALQLLGARYVNIRQASLVDHLSRVAEGSVNTMVPKENQNAVRVVSPVINPQNLAVLTNSPQVKPNRAAKDPKIDIYNDFCSIVEKVADVPGAEVKGSSTFDDLGVDSLMMIEVIAEIESFYKCDLPIEDLEKLTDVDSLVQYLHGRGCGGIDGQDDVNGSVSSSPADTPSDGASVSTSISTGATTPAFALAATTADGNEVCEKLRKLVAGHLELDSLAELTLTSNLADLGLDSLLCIELASDIQKILGVDIDMESLDETSTFSTLLNLVHQTGHMEDDVALNESPAPVQAPETMSSSSQAQDKGLQVAQQIFENLRFDFDKYGKETGFADFWEKVYPDQAHLVEAYIIETFRELGCDMASLANGRQLPPVVNVLSKHCHLMDQLHKILRDGGIIELRDDGINVRTAKSIDPTPAAVLFERMLQKYPQHTSETKLLNVSASCMVDCLTGKIDPLQLLFANRANREIMADVYRDAPHCKATTRLLAQFLAETFSASKPGAVFQILEVGAGTGGTATYIVDLLESQGIKFEYTFTDISSSLVAQAKRKFAERKTMKFMTFDCDRPPPPELRNKFDIVIATNCIHATKNATSSAANILPLLRDEGVFCLVEFTHGQYWFDLVYGLLEGWWLFSDGRQHALGDQWFWDNSLRSAGFKHVSWTDGKSDEAQTMRIICGFKANAEKESFKPLSRGVIKRAGLLVESLTWKKVGELELKADVYFPKTAGVPGRRRPIGLMIHGGGHLLFSRQDIPMKHVRELLQRGFLPVSVDYRLCPELSLFDGPVTDCRDALKWARETLPYLTLSGPNVMVDPEKVLALGWSSGGQLAMTLGYTAQPEGIKPPDVILPFYSPSDLEAEFWNKPIYPAAAEEPPTEVWGILDCVRKEPILEYTPMSNKRATALSLTLQDDRARLILHMNWKAQSVAVLCRGLPHKDAIPPNDTGTDWKNLPPPPPEEIRKCSPYWHIVQGDYRTPTFMVHGNADDWIPYQMTEKTIAALAERGVPSGILIPDQCGHAFDLFPKEDRLGVGWPAIIAAYDFACGQLGMSP